MFQDVSRYSKIDMILFYTYNCKTVDTETVHYSDYSLSSHAVPSPFSHLSLSLKRHTVTHDDRGLELWTEQVKNLFLLQFVFKTNKSVYPR